MLPQAVLKGIAISAIFTGLVWVADRFIHKVSPKWGAKLDEFWHIF